MLKAEKNVAQRKDKIGCRPALTVVTTLKSLRLEWSITQ
jgi:hypothetical protein